MKTKKELAIKHFIGKDGVERYNCVQTVLNVFNEDQKHDLDIYKYQGGGNAPDGLCGAVYAAKLIAQEKHTDVLAELEKILGHLTCRDLRANRVSCLRCIEESVNILQNN